MKRKGSARYDGTADKRFKLGDLTTGLGSMMPDDNGGSKILASIGAPFSTKGAGARVPDLNLQSSTTATFLLELTQTVNANGVTGGILNLCSGAITYCEEALPTSSDAQIVYCGSGPYAGGAFGLVGTNGQVKVDEPTWQRTEASAAITVTRNKLLPNFSTVYGQASALRITGAAIQVEFTGNDQNNQGLITSYNTSWSDIEQSQGFSGYPDDLSGGTNPFMNSTQAFAENFRTQYNGACKNGVNLSWLPVDNGDLEYGTVPRITSGYSNLAPVGGVFLPVVRIPPCRLWGMDATSPTDRDVRDYGSLVWHVSGAAASTATFRVTCIVHVEMLPINDTPSLGVDMAIAKPLNGVMAVISGNATGNTTGTPAETEATTEARGDMLEKAAQAAKKATNDDSLSTIASTMEAYGMTPDVAALKQAANYLAQIGKGALFLADTSWNLSPAGMAYTWYTGGKRISNASGYYPTLQASNGVKKKRKSM